METDDRRSDDRHKILHLCMTLSTPVVVCPPSFNLGAAEQQLLSLRVTLSDRKVEMDRHRKGCLFTALLLSFARSGVLGTTFASRVVFRQFDI